MNKYISDFASGIGFSSDVTVNGLYNIIGKKISNTLIESVTYLESDQGKFMLSGFLNKYKVFSTQVQLWEQLELKNSLFSPFTTYTWSKIDATTTFPRFETFAFTPSNFKRVYTANNYDTYGNPISITGEDGIVNSFTWDNNSSLLASKTQNSGAYQHQTNYTHKPLVGITRISDPNNRNINYTYDNFNRLKLTKDHSDNIESRYLYHYKGDADNDVDFTYSVYSSTPTTNTIQFSAKGTGQAGTKLIWDFGNGVVKENGAITELQTYTTIGTKEVTLATTHPEYPTASTRKLINILPPATLQITSPNVGSTRTVCGSGTSTILASIAPLFDYTYQWEHLYSVTGNWATLSTTGPSISFTYSGVQNSSSTIRCKISDPNGNSRYSNSVIIFYYCSGQPGPSDCPSGYSWNSQTGTCDPPEGSCGEGCFWNGSQCVCQ
jgi:hypothetical protein